MEVEVEGEPGPVLVTIPKGGVRAGQYFIPASATLLSDIHLSTRGTGPSATNTSGSTHSVPVGKWRDGFWDLCKLGPCHVTVWNSCCCPLCKSNVVLFLAIIYLCLNRMIDAAMLLLPITTVAYTQQSNITELYANLHYDLIHNNR